MLRASDTPEGFRKAFRCTEIIAADLDGIGPHIRRLSTTEKVVRLLSRFLKKSLIFQSFNFSAGLIVIPVIVRYLNLLAPDLLFFQDIWPYQKGFLLIGGISGICLAFFMATRGLHPE
jgi:hypothetical protein